MLKIKTNLSAGIVRRDISAWLGAPYTVWSCSDITLHHFLRHFTEILSSETYIVQPNYW